MTDLPPLRYWDLKALAEIVGAADTAAPVGRLVGNYWVSGIAVMLSGDDRGAHLPDAADLRTGWLRVTTDEGLEAFWPVLELISDRHHGRFSPHYPH